MASATLTSLFTDIADAIRTKKGEPTSDTPAPSEYTQIDYIESTGTQYIDTGYNFKSNKIRIRMEIENLNTTSGASLCGVESEAGYASILYSYELSGIFTMHMGVTAYITTIDVPNDDAFHTVEIETFGNGTGQIAVDGSTQNFSFTGNINGSLPFYIGALNMTSGATDFSKQRTRLVEMWDNDVLVRDYVACRYQDGSVGLYDKVNETLSYSPNGVAFTGSATEIGSIGTGDGTADYRLIPAISMADEILSIEGGTELPTLDTPATANHILNGYEAIDETGAKITGTIETKSEQVVIFPNANTQIIDGNRYFSEDILVAGDPYLESANIKNGVTIFGVTGNYVGTTIDASVDLSGVTAAASDVRSGKKFVNSSGNEVTGSVTTRDSNSVTVSGATVSVPAGIYDSGVKKSVSTATQATPSITVDSSGLITASATQSAGYVSTGTKSATEQLTTKAATTITPSTSNQTAVAKGVYTTGAVTVEGDSNLKASNIKSGVSIFGVAGSYTGSTTTTGQKTVSYTANEIECYVGNYGLEVTLPEIPSKIHNFSAYIQSSTDHTCIAWYGATTSNPSAFVIYYNSSSGDEGFETVSKSYSSLTINGNVISIVSSVGFPIGGYTTNNLVQCVVTYS